jgi:D-alanyl-D-alanine carboxypeptidase (penicillin-binding protein 5/6)
MSYVIIGSKGGIKIYFYFDRTNQLETLLIIKSMKKYLTQILAILIMLLIAWGLFLLGSKENSTEEKPIEATIYQSIGDPTNSNIKEEVLPVRKWSVKEPEISGQSAIIISFRPKNGGESVLYQKNINQILPIASLTKIMTAIIALENFNLEEVIKVSKNSVLTLGDKGGLIRGEELEVKNLLYIMLIESSNDAAMALASDNPRLAYEEFINLMNSKAKELGLENTHFLDPIGLNSKNKSTVFEIAQLTRHALDFSIIWEILKTSETTISSIDDKFIHNLTNTNELLDKISFLKGGKTGYTIEAGGCMLAVSDVSDSLGNNNYLITVVLSSDQREGDTEKLIIWAQEAYLW